VEWNLCVNVYEILCVVIIFTVLVFTCYFIAGMIECLLNKLS